jgi:hypothetical protein
VTVVEASVIVVKSIEFAEAADRWEWGGLLSVNAPRPTQEQ